MIAQRPLRGRVLRSAVVVAAAVIAALAVASRCAAQDLDDVGRAFTEGEQEYGVTIQCLVTLQAATGGAVHPSMSGVGSKPQIWTLTEAEEVIQVNGSVTSDVKRLEDGRVLFNIAAVNSAPADAERMAMLTPEQRAELSMAMGLLRGQYEKETLGGVRMAVLDFAKPDMVMFTWNEQSRIVKDEVHVDCR